MFTRKERDVTQDSPGTSPLTLQDLGACKMPVLKEKVGLRFAFINNIMSIMGNPTLLFSSFLFLSFFKCFFFFFSSKITVVGKNKCWRNNPVLSLKRFLSGLLLPQRLKRYWTDFSACAYSTSEVWRWKEQSSILGNTHFLRSKTRRLISN